MLALSGCVLTQFDIAKLRYFTPKGFSIKTYVVEIHPPNFIKFKAALVEKLNVTYASTSASVELKVGKFKNSFELHDFWYHWVKHLSGSWKALETEAWWFSGAFSKKGIRAWYSRDTVFVISSKEDIVLDRVQRELKKFVSVFSGVKS